MLCDISVVFNSFADAFGLMTASSALRAGKCLYAFNRANPLAASNTPAVVHSCANIWSTRSASTLMDYQPEQLWPPSWARHTLVFLPQSAYILGLATSIFSSLGRLTGILRADHARARTTTSKTTGRGQPRVFYRRPHFVQVSSTISGDPLSWCAKRSSDRHRSRAGSTSV
jgi:hypothetical protein